MKNIILATHNHGKTAEFKQMLANYPVHVLSLSELNYNTEIPETGTTFAENALIKARTIAACYPDTIVVADDSGLVVDALGGAPGVYSARYAGVEATDDENINKLLNLMKNMEQKKRSAKFICVIAVVTAEGIEHIVEGTCHGQILTKRHGSGGFGYDPIFYLPDLKKSMAELDKSEKNAISHRGQAFLQLIPLLGELL